MAVGNTGEYLEQAADAMCTWLSRDGGATWQDVMPYAGIYECAFRSPHKFAVLCCARDVHGCNGGAVPACQAWYSPRASAEKCQCPGLSEALHLHAR